MTHRHLTNSPKTGMGSFDDLDDNKSAWEKALEWALAQRQR